MAKPEKLWVITRRINAYEQEGQYFEAVYLEKPTADQIAELFHLAEDDTPFIDHLLAGGGRQKSEQEWYYLTEVEVGKSYDEDA